MMLAYTQQLKQFAQGFVNTEINARTHRAQNKSLVEELRLATSFLPDDLTNVPRVFCVLNDVISVPTCKVCDQPCPIWNYQFHRFKQYCSPRCQRKCETYNEKRKQTTLLRYGVENPFQSNKVKQKIKQTNLKKYGVENPQCCEEIREKTKQTNVERYGVDTPLQNTAVRNKGKQTNVERYGVENVSQNKTIKARKRQTSIRNYGVDNPSQSETVKVKKQQTSLERYGTNHPCKSQDVKEQIRQTNMQRYGVEYAHQGHLTRLCLERIRDYNWLYEQYYDQQRTVSDIANELEIGISSMWRRLKNQGFIIRQHPRYSFKCIRWLESIMKQQNMFIQHGQNIGEYRIPNTKLHVDGYCEETNTVYEFYGDFWHGNPEIYQSDFYNCMCNTIADKLYQKTVQRETLIKSKGYMLVTMWESNWEQGHENQ